MLRVSREVGQLMSSISIQVSGVSGQLDPVVPGTGRVREVSVAHAPDSGHCYTTDKKLYLPLSILCATEPYRKVLS